MHLTGFPCIKRISGGAFLIHSPSKQNIPAFKITFKYPVVATLWQGVWSSGAGGLKWKKNYAIQKKDWGKDDAHTEHVDCIISPRFTFEGPLYTIYWVSETAERCRGTHVRFFSFMDCTETQIRRMLAVMGGSWIFLFSSPVLSS